MVIRDDYIPCWPVLEGGMCEFDFDECASNPCQNGGVCTDSTFEPPCDRYGDAECCEAEAALLPAILPNGTEASVAHMTLRLLYGLHCNDSLWAEPSSGRRSLQSDSESSASESWLDGPDWVTESGSWGDSDSSSSAGWGFPFWGCPPCLREREIKRNFFCTNFRGKLAEFASKMGVLHQEGKLAEFASKMGVCA